MARKGQKFRKYSAEEKLKLVNMHLKEHISVREIQKLTGVNNCLICTWIRKFNEKGVKGLENHCGNHFAALHTSKTMSEIDRLRLLTLKQEIEIERLKKGYFVKGSGAKKVFVTSNNKSLK